MRSNKSSDGFVRKGPTASKPFMTEYKLAYKDPTPFIRKGGINAGISSRKKVTGGGGGSGRDVGKVGGGVAKEMGKDGGVKLPGLAAGGGGVASGATGTPGSEEANSGTKAAFVARTKRDLWAPPAITEETESTSLTLPGMLQSHHEPQTHFRRRRILGGITQTGHGHTARYNIISGVPIQGEPYSGYKEGRRAVIPSFAHIDSTTNARTPGYNIISNRDYLMETDLVTA
ncbi:hypothetical protein HDU76_011501 [Blyttiomyces sp. JEL0837]|nr:hypothetical protein HDU76_011501 [Blyttiomyces sp. JEL0837]